MKHKYGNDVMVTGFITIWIFARMKHYVREMLENSSFITIWIFARMKPNH